MPGARRSQQRARAAVVAFPRRRALGRLVPSGRSLVAGFVLLGLAVGVYVISRETSVFAIRRIEVRASPATAEEVRRALAPLQGTSLLALGGGAVERRVGALPDVVSATYDRAFPHTLRVVVVPERPVAVLRRGDESWLVSARGRIIRRLDRRAFLGLARIWVPRSTDLSLGATLADPKAMSAVTAVAPLAQMRFPALVATAENGGAGGLTLTLRSGLDVRLGDTSDLLLKLTIATQILPTLPGGRGSYLDLSVPERPVSGSSNPQVGG